MKKLKVAIVHDDFIQLGGAEFLIYDIIKEFKKIPKVEVKVYSSIINNYWKSKLKEIDTPFEESFLGMIPYSDKISKIFFILDFFYFAFESFDFSNFDVVFSSSTRFGHSVITKPSTLHISYLNSPSKMLWEIRKYFFGKKFLYHLVKYFLPKKRIYDYVTQQRADIVISNSKNIFDKIKKIYKRESVVIYPFINKVTTKSKTRKKISNYVLISRLVPWKRIDFVIDAFNKNQECLLLIGRGDKKYVQYLKSIAKKNIQFLGFVTDQEKYKILSRSKGLIVSQDEDFGLIIIESLSLSTPIIYFNKGGAKEILSFEFGESFEFQTSSSLNEAIQRFKKKTYNNSKLYEYSQKFTSKSFMKELFEIIESKL